MNEKIKTVLNTILEKFESGDIPEAVAMASFAVPDLPSTRWSFFNRTLMFLSGTCDARGFNQWRSVKRQIQKGSKAIYILVPCFKKQIDEETNEEKEFLSFFKVTPVFRVEDTEGEPLEYQQIDLPDIALIEKAKEWGISVKAVPGNYRYYGYYAPQRQEIAVASPEESVFFHEIAHAAHEKVVGKLKPGQDSFQEIVAELSAVALCRIVGKRPDRNIGNSYQYIQRYAQKIKLTPHLACMKVLKETEKVLELILKPANQLITSEITL
jgi:antirestriction protein ArdC